MSHLPARFCTTAVADSDKVHAVPGQPTGAVEQHGPHLPVRADAFVAEQARRPSTGPGRTGLGSCAADRCQ